MFLEAWAGGSARTTLGPLQAREDGEGEALSTVGMRKGYSGEQQSGPRDSQKPRGAVGGRKPGVKSNHTSRMGQCHRPQWPWARRWGLCPCQV